MKSNWILFTSKRYLKTKRKNKGMAPAFISSIGIAVGVMALISVLGVMNGFQLGFINDILEINSYHIRIEKKSDESFPENIFENIEEINEIRGTALFADVQAMAKGFYNRVKPCMVRGIDEGVSSTDPVLFEHLNIVEGAFNLKEKRSIVIGFELSRSLGLAVGDTMEIASLAGISFKNLEPVKEEFIVTGIFKSAYYEYNTSMAFTNINDINVLLSGPENIILGLKIKNRFSDKKIIHKLIKKTGIDSANIVSWREFNSTFFGALKMEKTIMMLLVGLIFIVVGVNISQSLKRSVLERKEEIAVLRSLGANPFEIQTIFLCEGLFIGLIGAVIGLLAGLFVSININEIFSLAEFIVNSAASFFTYLFSSGPVYGADTFSIFSSEYFYIQEVPVKLLFPEVMFIFLFAVFAATAASFFASSRISEIKPTQVLRYE